MPLSERGCRHPLLFAVLDLLVLLDQDKSTRRKKMHDRRNRFFGKNSGAKIGYVVSAGRRPWDTPTVAGLRRRSDAALCMGGCGLPLFGCSRRANLSKLYFSRPPACGIALQKQPNSHFGKHPAPPIGCLLQGADLPPFVTERWRQKCPQSTYVGIGRSNAEFAVHCAQR